MRTNSELIAIFKLYNGGNLVSALEPYHNYDHKFYRFPGKHWPLSKLKLFRDSKRKHSTVLELFSESLNHFPDVDGQPAPLKFAKSWVQVALTREMVDFVMNTLDTSILLRRLSKFQFLYDEFFIAPLNVDEKLKAPGGFTTQCWDKFAIEVEAIVRYG